MALRIVHKINRYGSEEHKIVENTKYKSIENRIDITREWRREEKKIRKEEKRCMNLSG